MEAAPLARGADEAGSGGGSSAWRAGRSGEGCRLRHELVGDLWNWFRGARRRSGKPGDVLVEAGELVGAGRRYEAALAAILSA